MIETKTITLFSIGSQLPNVRYLPHGEKCYNSLFDYHEKRDLENLISIEISNLKYSIRKYSRGYDAEDHKQMCEDMTDLQCRLEKLLTEVENDLRD